MLPVLLDVAFCPNALRLSSSVEKSYLFLATLQEQAIDTKKDTI